MSFLTQALQEKALRLAAQLARKSPVPDVAAVIRNALGTAGLVTDPAKSGAPQGPLTCMAPPGNLDAFLPDWRKARGLRTPDEGVGLPDHPGEFTWHSIKGPWGTRRYKLFVPEMSEPPRALLVMLHGCSQTPDDFAAGTQMNVVAAEHNVLVAYPEQTRSANMSSCWNWFDTAHQHAGAGEPALIAAISRAVMAEHGLASGRVFVAGLSAGGAMAAVLAQTDPALYAAVGIHSGLAYQAATDVPSAFAAMRGSRAPSLPIVEASAVPTIVFHGDADHTVHVSNADAIVAGLSAPGQRTTVHQGAADGGRRFTRTVARDDRGAIRFENWRVEGAGHAWSGGSRAGSYTDPTGPDASREMMRFFLEQIPGSRVASRLIMLPS